MQKKMIVNISAIVQQKKNRKKETEPKIHREKILKQLLFKNHNPVSKNQKIVRI